MIMYDVCVHDFVSEDLSSLLLKSRVLDNVCPHILFSSLSYSQFLSGVLSPSLPPSLPPSPLSSLSCPLPHLPFSSLWLEIFLSSRGFQRSLFQSLFHSLCLIFLRLIFVLYLLPPPIPGSTLSLSLSLSLFFLYFTFQL